MFNSGVHVFRTRGRSPRREMARRNQRPPIPDRARRVVSPPLVLRPRRSSKARTPSAASSLSRAVARSPVKRAASSEAPFGHDVTGHEALQRRQRQWGEIYDLLRHRDRLRLIATIVTGPRWCNGDDVYVFIHLPILTPRTTACREQWNRIRNGNAAD